jgi:hypothetical protein
VPPVDFFNDTLSRTVEEVRNWYWRAEVNLDTNTVTSGWNNHCECQTPYNPAVDCQHYCIACNMWFDIKCIGEARACNIDWDTEAGKINVPAEELLSKFVNTPVVRGMGTFECENVRPDGRWLVSGNGPWLLQAEGSSRLTSLEPQWACSLGRVDRAVVRYCSEKYWLEYVCPRCNKRI